MSTEPGSPTSRLRRPSTAAYGVVAGVWCSVYLILVIAGQRFSTAFAHGGWQVAPYEFLAATPVRTSLQMHVQPPLWNLLIGGVARWSPFPDGISFQIVMLSIGLLIALLACRICLLCGLTPRTATLAGIAIGLLPNTLHNVFSLAYELPTAALLLLAISLVVSADARLSQRSLVAVLLVLTVLGLTRSLYHPLWLAIAGVALLLMARASATRGRLALIVMAPVLLFGGLVVKNDVMVGSTSLASWEGMNLLRSIQPAIPQHDLDRLVAAGKISTVAAKPPFSPYADYADAMPPCSGDGSNALELEYLSETAVSPFTGEPVQIPNYNFRCFVPVYQVAGDDARTLIGEFPARWVDARLVALRTWFTDYPGADTPTGEWMRLAGRLSVPAPSPDLSDWNQQAYLLLVDRPLSIVSVTSMVLLALFVAAALRRWKRERTIDRAGLLVLMAGFVYFTTLAIAVTFELGEQARFRWGVEPVLFTALVPAVVWARRRRNLTG